MKFPLAIAIALSVLVHVAAFLALNSRPKVTPPSAPEKSITVRVVPTEKKKTRVAQESRQAPQASVAPKAKARKHRIWPKQNQDSITPSLPIRSYQDLLAIAPSNAEDEDAQDDGPEQGLAAKLGGKEAEQVMLSVEEIIAQFSLPYQFREMKIQGKAIAQIALRDTQRLFVISLSGDPYIRSALYALLKSPKTQALIREILTRIDEKELTFKIYFEPKLSLANSGLPHETSWKLEKTTLKVQQFYYMNRTGSAGGLSMVPKDELVEKDKAWDRTKLAELRDSPAYVRELENFWLGEN